MYEQPRCLTKLEIVINAGTHSPMNDNSKLIIHYSITFKMCSLNSDVASCNMYSFGHINPYLFKPFPVNVQKGYIAILIRYMVQKLK